MSKATLGIIAWLLITMLAVTAIDRAFGTEPPPNNEPFTGVCNEPTSQLGC